MYSLKTNDEDITLLFVCITVLLVADFRIYGISGRRFRMGLSVPVRLFVLIREMTLFSNAYLISKIKMLDQPSLVDSQADSLIDYPGFG